MKRNKDNIRVIVIEEALLVLNKNLMLREISELKGVSITTIYNDLTIKLPKYDEELARKVKEKFEENKHYGKKR